MRHKVVYFFCFFFIAGRLQGFRPESKWMFDISGWWHTPVIQFCCGAPLITDLSGTVTMGPFKWTNVGFVLVVKHYAVVVLVPTFNLFLDRVHFSCIFSSRLWRTFLRNTPYLSQNDISLYWNKTLLNALWWCYVKNSVWKVKVCIRIIPSWMHP